VSASKASEFRAEWIEPEDAACASRTLMRRPVSVHSSPAPEHAAPE